MLKSWLNSPSRQYHDVSAISTAASPNPARSPFVPPTSDTPYRRRTSLSSAFGDKVDRRRNEKSPNPYYSIKMADGSPAISEVEYSRPRRKGEAGSSRWGVKLLILLMFGYGGWHLGKGDKIVKEQMVCNPYDQKGFLFVNTSYAPDNRWIPFSAPPSCQPVDYTTLIATSTSEFVDPRLDFARNRTVFLFGDSIDREHNVHFCNLAKGRVESITDKHPLSPPYPEGEELPPEDFVNEWNGKREWRNSDGSRPFICHLDKLNLRIVNVFHFGYQGPTRHMTYESHYYPPATIEDRFDKIMVPLARNIANKYGTSPIPDLVELTPGLWTLLRLTTQMKEDWGKLIRGGMSQDEANARLNVWDNLSEKTRLWLEQRTFEVLRHIAKGWEEEETPGRLRRPQVLWRALHHIREHHGIPFSNLQTIDQIGLSVVDRLQEESRTARLQHTAYHSLLGRGIRWLLEGSTPLSTRQNEAVKGQLDRRLTVSQWGGLMLGQEHHFRDNMHPNALPGSFLWANIMLTHLKISVEERGFGSGPPTSLLQDLPSLVMQTG